MAWDYLVRRCTHQKVGLFPINSLCARITSTMPFLPITCFEVFIDSYSRFRIRCFLVWNGISKRMGLGECASKVWSIFWYCCWALLQQVSLSKWRSFCMLSEGSLFATQHRHLSHIIQTIMFWLAFFLVTSAGVCLKVQREIDIWLYTERNPSGSWQLWF